MYGAAPNEVELVERLVEPRRRRDGAGYVVTHHAALIRRSVDAVTQYLFDPTTMPQWSAVLYEIEPTADLDPRLGRRLRANLRILGVCITVEGELVDVDLGARQATVRVVPVETDGVLEHRLSVEHAEAGSVAHFWNEVELPTWLSTTLGEDLIHRFLDHTAVFALANIKAVLENGEEDNVRRLDRIARRHVPAPQRLQREDR
jgi:Polyketide cyclase / dehydrase and lipid transport